jgi:hypothetical protein
MMQQISVALPDDVLAYVQRTADRECRTVGAQVRFLITEAARRAGNPTANLEVWPPELMTVGPHNLAEAKAQVAEMKADYDRLRALERKSPQGLMPHDDERLRFCRDRIDALGRQIRPIELMKGARNG